jgi:regulator of protease activity HflC (stomatin/prohibitin superfamily)
MAGSWIIEPEAAKHRMKGEGRSRFDLRSLLAHLTLYLVMAFLCETPLFVVGTKSFHWLLKPWASLGIWWIIAVSVGANLVIEMTIRRLDSPSAERSAVSLWLISSAIVYVPFISALGIVLCDISLIQNLPLSYLCKLGWLPYTPAALLITAGLTTPKRLRIVLDQSWVVWPITIALLICATLLVPYWLSPWDSGGGWRASFHWWDRNRGWWVVIACFAVVAYARNALPFGTRYWLIQQRVPVLIAAFFVLFFLLCLTPHVLVIIPAGEVGVYYSVLAGGVQTDRVYGEGSHLKWPWDTITLYDLRVNKMQQHFDVISANGLTVGVTTSVRYYPIRKVLPLLHKMIGPDYAFKIVFPQVQSLVRRVFGHYTPEEIYTTKRELIESTLESAAQELGENYVRLNDLLVLSIELPPTIQDAIQSKLVQQQASEEMKFRISREIQEKERKLIEAEGIEAYNTVVRSSLQVAQGNDPGDFLRFKGIEATLELAKSTNSKIVVIGGSDRLPLIMDTETKPSSGFPLTTTLSDSDSSLPLPPAGIRVPGLSERGAARPTPAPTP